MKDLYGKVVLITGASSGIGEAAALAFDAAGAKLALAARREDRLAALALRLRDAITIVADLGDPDQAVRMVDQAVDYYGKIDILVNNAAAIIVVPAEEVTEEDLLMAYRTNLVSPVKATQRAVHHMKKQGGGLVINIGSPGFMMGIPFYTPYVCSKAAFSAWTRTTQAELAESRIMTCEYFPGYIRTESRPESRIGEVDQDFLMEQKQNFLTRKFAGPKTPETVAKQLVRLALRPKPLKYSGFAVHLGAFISNISSFRLSIARQMTSTGRKKIKR